MSNIFYNEKDVEVEILIKELISGTEYKVKVRPHSSTVIERGYMLVSNKEEIKKEVIESPEETIEESEELVEEQEEIIEDPTEVLEESPEEIVEEPETLSDKFICDICGQEYASARSLAAHKARSHKE